MKNNKCDSCSKEKQDKVPVLRVINKLDEYFSVNDLKGAEELLNYWVDEAQRLEDSSGFLSMLNEQVGLYRRLNDSEKGLKAVEYALSLINEKNFYSSAVATIYINCATTLKAFGKVSEGLPYYKKAEQMYLELNENDNFKYASLYNNMASAYAEIGKFKLSEESYVKAIDILTKTGSNEGEIAVSYVNLAHLYFENDPFNEKVGECMELAWDKLNSAHISHDGNFAFICSKCAPSFEYFGYFQKSEKLKNEAEKIYGRS